MEIKSKKKFDVLKVIIVSAVVCAALAGFYYLRVNTVEDIVAKLTEEGSMDNMIWFVKHFAALLPSIAVIVLLSLAYGNADKYVPVVTQKEKLAITVISALFFFGALMPIASSTVIPEVIEEEEVVKEATTVLNLIANWFFVQIIPFIIIASYHCIRADSEKKQFSVCEVSEPEEETAPNEAAEKNG